MHKRPVDLHDITARVDGFIGILPVSIRDVGFISDLVTLEQSFDAVVSCVVCPVEHPVDEVWRVALCFLNVGGSGISFSSKFGMVN